jgi:hypothetical protein
MNKEVLHNLVDLLDESDTEVIYRVLMKFVPEVTPYVDEVRALQKAKSDIAMGDVKDFDSIDWDDIKNSRPSFH